MKPWQGKQSPPSADILDKAAQQLNCEVAVIRAVWSVESGGRYFDERGVISRFEPHKMPGSPLTWRDSLKIKRARRWTMFLAAYDAQPENALKAASWGAPQIMGFNHKKTGYPTAIAMVKAMALHADNQVNSFVAFLISTGLDTHLRSKDFYSFAKGYNGSGQAGVYSEKIRAALIDKHVVQEIGQPTEIVIRKGSKGKAVRTLQQALNIEVDGQFGMDTYNAVTGFQKQRGLKPDGVVGAKTWAALRLPKTPMKKTDWAALIINIISNIFGGQK